MKKLTDSYIFKLQNSTGIISNKIQAVFRSDMAQATLSWPSANSPCVRDGKHISGRKRAKCLPAAFGVPAEAQRSGFGGGRSRSKMNDACRLRQGERYAACGDEVRCSGLQKLSEKAAGLFRQSQGLPQKFAAAPFWLAGVVLY